MWRLVEEEEEEMMEAVAGGLDVAEVVVYFGVEGRLPFWLLWRLLFTVQ